MEFPPLEWVVISINCRKLQVSGNFARRESSEDSIFMSHHTSFVTTLTLHVYTIKMLTRLLLEFVISVDHTRVF